MPSASFKKILCPATEGIKYAGSKLKLLLHGLRFAAAVKTQTVFDAFKDATRVSQTFVLEDFQELLFLIRKD